MKKVTTLLILSCALLFPSMGFAAEDHPLLGRYNDAKIALYGELPYEQFSFVTAAAKDKETEIKELEGKITHHTYNTTSNDTVLRVTRNYEQALRKAGFETVFQCEKATCGSNIPKNVLAENTTLFPQFYAGYVAGGLSGFDHLWQDSWNYTFLTAKKTTNNTGYYLTLVILKSQSLNFVAISQDIVEVKEMETDLVAEPVGLSDIENGIAQSGYIALDGIYFETNKDIITSDSQKTLAVIAEYLTKHKRKNFYVVGHTDTVGSYDFNINLAHRRAKAVVEYLTSQHNIKAERLQGVGVGEAAPVASNANEQGRAQNRRVELVLSEQH